MLDTQQQFPFLLAKVSWCFTTVVHRDGDILR